MSGGVDSSVAAALLKKQGFSVVGVFMKNWSQDFGDFGCTWASDSEDARKVAKKLDIPFYVWDFEKEYYDKVVKYFLREYQLGRTPNPDVMCNQEIKFKVFLEKALDFGADFVATGHYARIKKTKSNGREIFKLMKASDPAKEQSYFLYTLRQEQLSKILFPIGGMLKSEVRSLARKFKLPNADKKDSQGICFIGKINVRQFLMAHLKARPGKILTAKKEIVGTHLGLPFYTIGQREGIGIGGSGPYYAIAKDLKRNVLVVTNDPEDKLLWRKDFVVSDVTWTGKAPKFPLRAKVAIRYHHPEYPALIKPLKTGKLSVTFAKPQRAITIGQSAVVYLKNELLGGGIIEQVL